MVQGMSIACFICGSFHSIDTYFFQGKLLIAEPTEIR